MNYYILLAINVGMSMLISSPYEGYERVTIFLLALTTLVVANIAREIIK